MKRITVWGIIDFFVFYLFFLLLTIGFSEGLDFRAYYYGKINKDDLITMYFIIPLVITLVRYTYKWADMMDEPENKK